MATSTNSGSTLEGDTPLIAAAQHGNLAVVRALLNAGADKTKTCYGRTALDVAKAAKIKSLLR